jgi:hypothetical protein
MQKPKIIFHIGLERTGTTSFQRYCTNNKSILLKNSLLYPTKNAAFSAGNHGPLVSSYLQNDNNKDFSIRSSRLKRPDILMSMLTEVERAGVNTVLISSEHFSSRFGKEEIRQLASDFSGYECQVFVVVRDHLSRFYSSYSPSVMSGSQLSIEDYAAAVFMPENNYLRYRDTITPWEETFGKAHISIYTYFPGKNVIPTLLENIIGQGESLPAPSFYADNRSLGSSLTEALRLTNIALSSYEQQGRPQTYMEWLQQRYFQVCLKRWLVRVGGDQSHDQWRLKEHSLQRLNEIAEIDRRWLEDEYGVRLPAQKAEACRDLSDYPSDLSGPGTILAKALVEQAKWRRWDVIDAAAPALVPLLRVFDRWRMKKG